jgi:hypothetical protein
MFFMGLGFSVENDAGLFPCGKKGEVMRRG